MAYRHIADALNRVCWIQDNGDFNSEVDSILQDVAVDLEAALEDLDASAEEASDIYVPEVDQPALEGDEAQDEPVMTTYTGPANE